MLKRIYILGNSGSGKTSLSKKLSSITKIKSYDLDNIFWEKKFSLRRNKKKALILLSKIIMKKQWIIEGVYSSYAEKGIKRAELIIWLDYPFHIVVSRLIRRQIKNRQIKNLAEFIKYIWDYKKKPAHPSYKKNEANYYKHKELIENHCLKNKSCNYIKIKNGNDLKKLLESFSKTK